jgi:hypothetical protein
MSRDDKEVEGMPRFDRDPCVDMIFGGLASDGTSDSTFFKSVFLSGKSMAEEDAAAKRAEEDAWLAKVSIVPPQTINSPVSLTCPPPFLYRW